MGRNYNTQNGKIYPRIAHMQAMADEFGNGTGLYAEKLAMTAIDDITGQPRAVYLEGGDSLNLINIPIEAMDTPRQLYDPRTGQNLGSAQCEAFASAMAQGKISGRLFYIMVYSICHEDQLRRDADADALAAAQGVA